MAFIGEQQSSRRELGSAMTVASLALTPVFLTLPPTLRHSPSAEFYNGVAKILVSLCSSVGVNRCSHVGCATLN